MLRRLLHPCRRGLATAAHAQKPADANALARALHALFDREWEWELTQDPLWASYLGDRRWNDRWPDISAATLAARQAHRAVGAERSRRDPARSALGRRPPQLRPVPASVSDDGGRLSASPAPDSHIHARRRAGHRVRRRFAALPDRQGLRRLACAARRVSRVHGSEHRADARGHEDQRAAPEDHRRARAPADRAARHAGARRERLLPAVPHHPELVCLPPIASGWRNRAARARSLARAARIREAARVHGSRVPAGCPTTASAGGARAAGSRAIATSRSTTRRPISRRRIFTRSA